MRNFILFRLPFLPFLVAPLLLLSPVLFTGKALFWGTPFLQFVPWRAWAWETLRSGHLPLWNPLVGMGAPLFANYQSALFYPPNWLLFLLAMVGGVKLLAWGQALLVAFHLTWSASGMALLTRKLGMGVLAQTISGLAFGLSAYLVSRAGFLSINSAVAWVPWVLLYAGLSRRFDEAKFSFINKRTACLALVLAMQLLAGHAQITWYTLLLAGAWFGYWGWKNAICQSSDDEGRKSAESATIGKLKTSYLRIRGVARSWAQLAVALALGTALSAVQLLPTFEYLQQSQRATAVNYDFAMTYSFWPWRFLTLVVPNLFGNPAHGDYWGYSNYWEDALYVGLLPLLLAVSVIFRWKKNVGDRKSLIYFLLALIVISFALALGNNTAFYPWLYQHVPTFDMFQAPTRYSLWAVFAFALLAGVGAEVWRRPEKRSLYWTRLGTAGAFAVTLGAGLTWYFMRSVSPTFLGATALAGLWGLGSGILSLLVPISSSNRSNPGLVDQPRFGAGKKTGQWSMVVVVFITADLVIAGWGLNPGVDLDLFGEQVDTEGIRSFVGESRLYIPATDEYELIYNRFFRFEEFESGHDWIRLREVMLPNINMLEKLSSVNNFDPLVPRRYARWMDALEKVDAQRLQLLLKLMGVSVVERMDLSGESDVRYELIERSKRLHWFACARFFEDEDEAWENVFDLQTDLSTVVILEGKGSAESQNCLRDVDTGSQVRIESENPNRVVIRVHSSSSGWLMLSDIWYPGWQALVDGEAAHVYKADYLFRAVQLRPGEHEVVFVYRPRSLILGVMVSFLAIVGMAVIVTKVMGRE